MTTETKPSRPNPLEVIGRPPESAPAYAGPPMNIDIWIAKYFPDLAAWRKRINWEFFTEKLDGPFDSSDLMPPGATEPAKYPAYFFLTPVHTYPDPAGLHPAFGPFLAKWGQKTQFYFTSHEGVKFWLKKAYGEDFQPRRVLDMGCGNGTTTFAMAEIWPDAEIIGTDLAPSCLRYARRKAEEQGVKNVSFYHLDMADHSIYPDEHFDVVNESYCLHEMPTYHSRAIVREMIRLSKPGHVISWFDWPPAESEGDLERRKNAVRRKSEPFMLQYLDLRLEHWLPELGLKDVKRLVRAGANMMVVATK
jgi:ubiquinone/menaquinone biosynthesis C-methylase UbiE